MAAAQIKETDLYPPLKSWLEANGYDVFAEVNDCDIAARRGEELILIEMKRAINLDLILQAVRRQEVKAAVYAAVPAPANPYDKRWRELTRLLKRLEIGLLLVYVESALPRVELASHPIARERRRAAAPTRAILREMSGRSLDLNVGGSHRRRLMTAYREQAIKVAVALESLGPSSPKALRNSGTSPKTYGILTGNPYGWFERVEKGVYALTDTGRAGIGEHSELADMLRQSLRISS